jgi:sulfur relay (sulfurtransferase) complex TusBCD TusD component (DsrE family)
MKIAVLLKSGPSTAEADRALNVANEMLSQKHSVSLCLLQDAVHLGRPDMRCFSSVSLQSLIENDLTVHVLIHDCALRGISSTVANKSILAGDYDSLIDLLESSDRVVGIF